MRTIESGYMPGIFAPELIPAAAELLRSCIELLATGPAQYRIEFGRLLPLTELELDLLEPGQLRDNPAGGQALAVRLGEWMRGNPIFVDDRSVHVADFLRRLRPNLGLSEQRAALDAMINRSLHQPQAS